MPRYYQKITRLMSYKDFKVNAFLVRTPLKRAFLEILFWSGRRVSEILRLQDTDLNAFEDTLYLDMWHMKKHTHKTGAKKGQSKNYKRVQQIPLTPWLSCILKRVGVIFPHNRLWGYRVVKSVFPRLYPHYFRLNRGTQTGIAFGDTAGRTLLDISVSAYESYSGDIDLIKVYATNQKEAFG